MKKFKFLFGLFFIFILSLTNCVDEFETLKVESCSPGSNLTGIDIDVTVRISFNNNVNKNDVENNFSLTGDSGSVEGTFNWVSGKEFIFTPRYDLDESSRYVIEIPRSVRDSNNNTMESDFLSDFYVGDDFDKPGVLSSDPVYTDGGTQAVDVDSNIRIDFSKSMNREKTDAAFSITPSVPGYFEWSTGTSGFADSRLTYVLTDEMEYGKQYKFALAATAEDTSGNSLVSEYSVIFITGTDFTPPEVAGIYDAAALPPPYWDTGTINTGVDKNVIIAVDFIENNSMERTSTESAFSITPSVSGLFSWQNGDTRLIFTPDEPLESEQVYQVKIDTTARDINGLKLEQPHATTIQVNSADSLLVIVGGVEGSNDNSTYNTLILAAWPVQIQMGLPGTEQDYYMRIQFVANDGLNTPVEMDKYTIFDNYLFEHFGDSSHDAAVDDVQWIMDIGGLYSIVQFDFSALSNDLVDDAVLYRLTLYGGSDGIKDANGNTMDGNFVIEFRE